MLDITTLHETYKALTKRSDRLKAHIEQTAEKLKQCDRLQKDFPTDYYKSLLSTLEGLDIAIDIVFKAIEHKNFIRSMVGALSPTTAPGAA